MKRVLILSFLLFLSTPPTNVQGAKPPPELLKIDSVVVVQYNDRAYRRAARERAKVRELMRYLIEERKFQFDARYYKYRDKFRTTDFKLNCYGGRIVACSGSSYGYSSSSYFMPGSGPSHLTNPFATYGGSYYSNGVRRGGWGGSYNWSKNNGWTGASDRLSVSFNTTSFKITNIREEGLVLLFDINMGALMHAPHSRRLFYNAIFEFAMNMLDGRMTVKITYCDEDHTENGPEYYGYINTLR